MTRSVPGSALAAVASGGGFAELARLVAAGAFSGLDGYVVEHWVPPVTSVQAAQPVSRTGGGGVRRLAPRRTGLVYIVALVVRL
jgi:hypothetical protein